MFYCADCDAWDFEFVDCRGGMTWWRCRKCGEMEPDYNDLCSGG